MEWKISSAKKQFCEGLFVRITTFYFQPNQHATEHSLRQQPYHQLADQLQEPSQERYRQPCAQHGSLSENAA